MSGDDGLRRCPQCFNTYHMADKHECYVTLVPKNTGIMYDPVTKPKHYGFVADTEAIDIIRNQLSPEEFRGYCLGNALKYRLRAGEKGDAEEDLRKSNVYRDWYNASLEEQEPRAQIKERKREL